MTGDFREYLKEKIKREISDWDKEGIYAVYIGVSDNNRMDEPLELPFILELGYGRGDKKDWRLACGIGNEKDLIETREERDALIGWLEGIGAENIGIEDSSKMYDKAMRYVGKGPGGMYETLETLMEIVRELFSEGFISESFGVDIPVIFDHLETPWYSVEATKKANPEGLADEYLRCLDDDMEEFRRASLSPFMVVGSVVRVIAFLPCAMLSAVIVLIAGGIHFPIGIGGAVKGLIALFAAVMRSGYMLRLWKSCSDIPGKKRSVKPAVSALGLTLFDIALGTLALFSWAFLPERLLGAVYVLGAVVYIALDYRKIKKAAGGLMQGELMEKMEELIRMNGSFKENKESGQPEDENVRERARKLSRSIEKAIENLEPEDRELDEEEMQEKLKGIADIIKGAKSEDNDGGSEE
ncbi:MAG: hypothetical protein K2K57_14910 [Oscillospiraceae bacterium]|nr:hypothetical protein [Oscillospiraceae bacterium]